MATLIIVLTAVAFGALFGGFLIISFAIRREDRGGGWPQSVMPDASARAARALVGLSSSRPDD